MNELSDIEELIKKALGELISIYDEKGSSSRMIFPESRKTKTKEPQRRISEQEAVFLLTREIELSKTFFYSVEAPTSKPYIFKKENPETAENGSSGSIDICVYINKDAKKRSYLLEFKAHSPKQKMFDKDFLKLKTDDSETLTNYFIHIIYQCEKRTLENVVKKYAKSLNSIREYHSGSKIKICLCLLGNFPKYGTEERIFFFNEEDILDKLKKIIEKIYAK